MPFSEEEIVLISALNQYVFCPRRCALIHVEGAFVQNYHTLQGTLEHGDADVPGYEIRNGARVVRALPLSSMKYGLSGKADWVEFRDSVPYPVEMKHGARRAWENDDVQLCAQALCLEESLGVACPMGAIYHVASRRRREVDFDENLRDMTVETVGKVRQMLASLAVPPAQLLPHCDGCSLHGACLPELSGNRLEIAAKKLFKPLPWT